MSAAKELMNGNKSEEELEETLSLSDLVMINDDPGGNNSTTTTDHHTSFSIENDPELFEFYKQADHDDHYSSPNQSFIFCGKIIHCSRCKLAQVIISKAVEVVSICVWGREVPGGDGEGADEDEANEKAESQSHHKVVSSE